MIRNTKVAVTGIGCLCAAGRNLEVCMDSLFAGKRQPAPPAIFTSSHSTAYPVFEVPEELSPDTTRLKTGVLRTAQMALVATEEALANAGLKRELMQTRRMGVCIGTTVGSAMNNEEFYRELRQGGHSSMTPIVRFLNSNPAQAIAREYSLKGPCQTVVNACSASTDALGIAASWIRSGFCDAVIAGGSDELCRVTYNGFISLMITDDLPCRPFDKRRKGLNLGEGAAIMIMESEGLRRERKCPARAFILSYGSACDAYHLTAPHPDGRGLKQAITNSMAASGKSAADIAFVNAHGTGTPDNDRVESRALDEILPGVPFLSTKGYTGHTLGAAGAIEAAFTVACLEAKKIPASAGFLNPDPELPVAPVRRTTPVKGPIAISQSLAFGGNNAVVVLEKGND